MQAFSQRDPRWSGEKLGTGQETIGEAGCLMTSVASLLADFGAPMDPHRLNQWLIGEGGYYDGNLIIFNAIKGLGANLLDYIDCERVPAPVDYLTTMLSGGCSVVIEVDYEPGGPLNRHWVRLASLQPLAGWIMDPWELPGAEMAALPDYLASGWTAARGIFGAAVYAPAEGAQFAVAEPNGKHQEVLCIRHG